MKSLSVLIFCLISNFTFTQQTYIPDDGFEQALIFEGLDTIMDDSISTATIDTLSLLYLQAFGIVDMTGIEDFTSLKYLICRNNNINNLNLSNNTELLFLNCENNNIPSLDLTNCPFLTEVRAEDNNLTSLDLTQNPLLEKLEISLNNIQIFDLSPNPLLDRLLAKNTGANSINISNNPLLELIDVSTNNLTSIDLTNKPNLKQLIVSANDLTAVDLSSSLDLELFFGNGNQFIELDFDANALLTFISCSFSPIEIVKLPNIDTSQHQLVHFVAHQNPNLHCIYTAYPNYVIDTWNYNIDSTASFSNACFLDIEAPIMSFKIYPNPSHSGIIRIASDQDFTYRLFSMTGKIVDEGSSLANESILFTSKLSSGMYIVELKNGNEIISKKIQIQ